MRLPKLALLSIACSFFSCCTYPKVSGQFTDQEFDEMAQKMAKGETPEITVGDLKANYEKYVILDAREKKEFEVSHLPGAVWVGYDDFTLDRLTNIDKNKDIVVYCSVGYRSERIGQKLASAGYAKVHNLFGSLFKWVNSGYTVVDAEGRPTQKVHGYNSRWARWIKNGDVQL